MVTLMDAWPVVGGAFSFPVICFALYRWVVRQLLAQIHLLTEQRNAADARAIKIQEETDGLDKKLDEERVRRREAEDIASTITGITRERDDLLLRLRSYEGHGS